MPKEEPVPAAVAAADPEHNTAEDFVRDFLGAGGLVVHGTALAPA